MSSSRSASSTTPRTSRTARASAHAATQAVEGQSTTVTLPVAGTLHLPSKGTLTYFAAIGALAAFGVIEWPIAAVVGIGHLLAQQRGNAVLEEFGEGLSDA